MAIYYEEIVDLENNFIALGSTPVCTMNNKGLEACLQKQLTKWFDYLGQSFIYCNVYSCCYATTARRNTRCIVTAAKHVNNIQAIARQMFGKRVPAAANTHVTVEVLLDYNNGNGVFYVVRAEKL
jgi:hypothetical protein